MHQEIMCGMLLKQINDELEKRGNNTLRSKELTTAQVGALFVLNSKQDGAMPLKELEHSLHVAQSTAAGIISRLEQKGLVESYGDPSDRRIKMVRISEKGRSACEDAYGDMQKEEQRLLSELTEAEQMIFISLLRKVRDSVK